MAIAVQPTRSGVHALDAFEPLDIAVDRCKGCGLCLAVWRVLRCQPFTRGGYDPVVRSQPPCRAPLPSPAPLPDQGPPGVPAS